MARVIEDLHEGMPERGPNQVAYRLIDAWVDGQHWELRQGEDFPYGLRTMREYMYRYAKNYGVSVSITLVDEVVLRMTFCPATEDQGKVRWNMHQEYLRSLQEIDDRTHDVHAHDTSTTKGES